MEDCTAVCASTSLCIAMSFGSGNCYLIMPASKDCSTVVAPVGNAYYTSIFKWMEYGGSTYASETCNDITASGYSGYECWCVWDERRASTPHPTWFKVR